MIMLLIWRFCFSFEEEGKFVAANVHFMKSHVGSY